MFFSDLFMNYYFLIFIVVIFGVIYWYQTKNFSYWKHLGVPSLEPDLLFGNIKDEVLQRRTWNDFSFKVYKQFKEHGLGGVFLFRTPSLVICDSQLIEKVLIQDFDHFQDRWVAKMKEPLMQSLFYTSGEKWRIMRHKLGTAFSTNKVRSMFEQTLNCSDCMMQRISEGVKDNKSLEIGPFGFMFATDVIASCAFGLQFQSDSVEGKMFKYIMDLLFVNSPWRIVTFMYKMVHPKIVKWFKLKYMLSEVESYFSNLCRTTIEYRRQNLVQRNDFLGLMMSLTDEDVNGDFDSSEEDTSKSKVISKGQQIFTEDAIAAAMLNFYLAGIKSTESTVSFALFEIAKHPNIQETLRKEINSTIAKHRGWTYEAIRDLIYLDQVIQETMRMYTYNSNITRCVTQPYSIPDTNLLLKKGLTIIVPAAAIHMDPQFYPSPEEFIPERFKDNNYKSSSRYLPFGAGPRICVSIKLAVTMMKVYLARILAKYSIAVDANKMKLPLEFDAKKIFINVKGGIWIKFEDLQM